LNSYSIVPGAVVSGLANRQLAQLSNTGLAVEVVVLASDDPNGTFAFPTTSQERKVAEDYDPGNEASAFTNFTVERRQGTTGSVQVTELFMLIIIIIIIKGFYMLVTFQEKDLRCS
jgi:hypothetical protein